MCSAMLIGLAAVQQPSIMQMLETSYCVSVIFTLESMPGSHERDNSVRAF